MQVDPLTEKQTDFTEDFLLKSKCMKPYKRRTKDRRDVEQIDKGHSQHEHDEGTNIQCHCSAKETKKSYMKQYATSPLNG